MRWVLGLMLLMSARRPSDQESMYTRMKVAYCYSSYVVTSQKSAVTAEVRASAKANADSLFPRYQRALEESKGTLAETALNMETAKARTAESRDLSGAEFFMIQETCDRLVDKTDK